MNNQEVGLYLDLTDIDLVFQSVRNPRILQRITDRYDDIKDIIYTVIDRNNPTIDNRAMCECGHTTIQDEPVGGICKHCYTEVLPRTERSMLPSLYMETPRSIDHFLHPYLYYSLRHSFEIGVSTSPYNPFVVLLANAKPQNELHKIVSKRMPSDLIGYNKAVANFPNFLRELATIVIGILTPDNLTYQVSPEIIKMFKQKETVLANMHEAINLANTIEKHNLPYKSKVLAVRSKLLLTLEEGNTSYADETTSMYSAALVYLNNLPRQDSELTSREISSYRPETRIVRFYEQYADMRQLWYSTESSKGGAIRTDTIAARASSTMRSVQVQNCKPHKVDESELPYSQGIILLYAHIFRKFKEARTRTGCSIIEFIEDNLRVHNKELYDVAQSCLADFRDNGGVTANTRYPSIYRWSMQQGFPGMIKADPDDHTLSVSAASLPGSSGDKQGSCREAGFF